MKKCSRCAAEKPRSEFPIRSASPDGLNAACRVCINEAKQVQYWTDPTHRQAAQNRVKRDKQLRFEREPAYKRAFNLHASNRRRKGFLRWTKIIDFIALCEKAERLEAKTGRRHVIDHVIPLNHPLVCGLHVPANCEVLDATKNAAKSNRWCPD